VCSLFYLFSNQFIREGKNKDGIHWSSGISGRISTFDDCNGGSRQGRQKGRTQRQCWQSSLLVLANKKKQIKKILKGLKTEKSLPD
jgi:hypothetical protein